ncbi:MAG: hypothetical protein AB1635_02850 [Acidobacteriota bacterium]
MHLLPVILAVALQGGATAAPGQMPPSPDPAIVRFATPAGLLLVTVKPDRAADYEAAIVALQRALARTDDPERRALAEGWRVFKAEEADAKGAVIYVHIVQPAVETADYRPSLLLDALLTDPPSELLAKYRDAFAGPPTKLSLTELAHMAVEPVARPAGNATPAKPGAPKPPGR